LRLLLASFATKSMTDQSRKDIFFEGF